MNPQTLRNQIEYAILHTDIDLAPGQIEALADRITSQLSHVAPGLNTLKSWPDESTTQVKFIRVNATIDQPFTFITKAFQSQSKAEEFIIAAQVLGMTVETRTITQEVKAR